MLGQVYGGEEAFNKGLWMGGGKKKKNVSCVRWLVDLSDRTSNIYNRNLSLPRLNLRVEVTHRNLFDKFERLEGKGNKNFTPIMVYPDNVPFCHEPLGIEKLYTIDGTRYQMSKFLFIRSQESLNMIVHSFTLSSVVTGKYRFRGPMNWYRIFT